MRADDKVILLGSLGFIGFINLINRVYIGFIYRVKPLCGYMLIGFIRMDRIKASMCISIWPNLYPSLYG